MSNWTDYLASHGARFHIDEASQVEDFGRALTAAELAEGFVAPVTDLGLIAATGEDAPTFLHSQLTNDVQQLAPGQARLAGYCTPKGRLLATFLMWRDDQAIYLQLPRELQAPLQKRLSMFVLRAKARLADATLDPAFEAAIGVGGAKGEAALRQQVAQLPGGAYQTTRSDAGTVVRLADAFGAPRYLWLTTAANATAALPALKDALPLGGNQAWHLAAVHAAVPQVTAKTQEQFVPQMVNLELLGGVNFKKGCYPGQEIVARSQYLGKLKRRMALATIDNAAALAGQEVFSTADPDQPCGMIVNAAVNGVGGADALIEMKLASLEDDVHLGSAGGAKVSFLPMPYPLDALDV
jgi:folate-binding protein YgfZ